MKTINKILIASLYMLLMSQMALATNTYAEAGVKWFLDGLFWVSAAAGISYGGMSLIKRNVTQGITILLGAAIVCLLCKEPAILERVGTVGKNILGL